MGTRHKHTNKRDVNDKKEEYGRDDVSENEEISFKENSLYCEFRDMIDGRMRKCRMSDRRLCIVHAHISTKRKTILWRIL